MGLDNLWELPENTFIEFDPELAVVSAWEGSDNFRGEAYDPFFEDELDVSLYDDLSNDEVRAIADKLASLQWRNEYVQEYGHPENKVELLDLTRMFQAYARSGATLRAWY